MESLLLDIAQLIEAEKAKTSTVSTFLQFLSGKEREWDVLKLERARFYKERSRQRPRATRSA
ncbi:hypothetical protein MTQ01_01585 [Streptomyces sp. XM4193]|uniref:hypothetical protein n=1 Tax=Streptomyces sp. XM4193 TaxID=2929782 RepID=UPI001FF738EC|nr:hypothetical protein [Streptomyces sp. XM4193]MCK1794738.1 hypothetical protein [Streptomyces sp. XM4193]